MLCSNLRVQWEGVEAHRAYERDVRGLRVQDGVLGRHPQPRVLRQHLDHFERLEIVNEDVGQPQVLDQLQVDRHQGVRSRFIQLLQFTNLCEGRYFKAGIFTHFKLGRFIQT